jgi:hypothetical protein
MTPDDVSATPIFDELLREMAGRTSPATPGPSAPEHPVPPPIPSPTPSPGPVATPSPTPQAPDPSRRRRHRAE